MQVRDARPRGRATRQQPGADRARDAPLTLQEQWERLRHIASVNTARVLLGPAIVEV